jgi:hypothetical protein
MVKNLALDDDLINAAITAGGHRSKKEAVTVALEEYLRLLKRRRAIDLMGDIDLAVDPPERPDRTFFDHDLLQRVPKATHSGSTRKSA